MTDLATIFRRLVDTAPLLKLKWTRLELMDYQEGLPEPDPTLAQLLTEVEARIQEMESPMYLERCLRKECFDCY